MTAAIALVKRSNVSHQYLSYRTAPLTHTQRKAVKQIHTSKQRISYLARADLARIKTGDAIGQIEIPKIGHTYNVVQGDQTARAGGRSRPLSVDGAAGNGPDGRDRRPPHHVPGAVPLHQRAARAATGST